MHIGLDLDNTIIDYEHVFGEVAASLGLLSASAIGLDKEAVKAALRASSFGEEGWMQVQGQVYGRHIGRARLYDGVEAFLLRARRQGARVSIVSHKTRLGHFDPERIDLWEAARGFLRERRFFEVDGIGLAPDNVHFLETREEKVARIANLDIDVFVDDLPEVLLHESFPRVTRAVWFCAGNRGHHPAGLERHGDWAAIERSLLAARPDGRERAARTG